MSHIKLSLLKNYLKEKIFHSLNRVNSLTYVQDLICYIQKRLKFSNL